ncbi:MAG: hypothetical protein O3C40_05000 [Planctomycetota bacterium]|nr:hypothetical protein [Planctomycetota bacterium]
MHTLVLLTLSLAATTQIPDGSLLVLEHSNKPVAKATGSNITHVAIIFHHGDSEWVYEATPAKARRVALAEYRRELGELNRNRRQPTSVSVLKPKYPYSEMQIEKMRAKAASQIGRRYSVKGYVLGKETDGIHCAHFAAAALEASGRFQFDQAYAISPGELIAKISPLHKPPVRLTVEVDESDESWCERSWTAWFNYGAWCRWACYETWTFCW